MKKYIPTFDEFVNESENGFDPMNREEDKRVRSLSSITQLLPGKEYCIKANGVEHTGMVFQGYSGGVYVFNQEDHKEDFLDFDKQEMEAIISASGVIEMDM